MALKSLTNLESLTNVELREAATSFAMRLRAFQTATDDKRNAALDQTLPGWSEEAQAIGFRRVTRSLQHQHRQAQSDFTEDYQLEALALQSELMARLGIPVRHDGEPLLTLRYDCADYLEELAARLVV